MPRSADAPVIVDARGLRCPWPVLRAARAMRESDHVVLIADDPIALREVPDMADSQGWRCAVDKGETSNRFVLNR